MRKAFCLFCVLVLASVMGAGVSATVTGGGGCDGHDGHDEHGVCDPHQHPHDGQDPHGHGDRCRCAHLTDSGESVDMCAMGDGQIQVVWHTADQGDIWMMTTVDSPMIHDLMNGTEGSTQVTDGRCGK